MKVVHWNLHHGGVGSDGKLNVQAITDALVGFAPDYVSLNELEENDGYGHIDQLEQHRLALQTAQGVPWYATFCALNGGSKVQGIGVAVLAKQPGVASRRDLGGRPMLTMTYDGLTLVTTHPDPDSAVKRGAQLGQVLVQTGILSMLLSCPTLICGDFNAAPSAVEVAAFPVYYKDAWVEGKRLGVATAFNDGSTHGKSRIDYQWSRGLVLTGVAVPDTRNPAGVFPSDHYPVVATYA